MIPVTGPRLPEKSRFLGYIESCYQNRQLTKQGLQKGVI